MQCEICHAELAADSIACPECGAPILQNVECFENTMEIQRILRTIMVENCKESPFNTRKLVALMKDYLTDYKKECRLLIYVIDCGILKNMLSEPDRNIAIMRAKSRLVSECFISQQAAEFVLCCLTYMLKWPYKSEPVAAPEPVAAKSSPSDEKTAEPAEKHEDKKDKKKNRTKPPTVDSKVFRPIDAVKFRLTRNVIIPDGYTKIEGFSFDKYGFISSVVLPDTVMAIGEYAFSGCKHLKSISIPESVKLIREGAFCQCSELDSVKIPEGILEIADNTFMCCESLQVMVIPSSVSSIGVQAFSGCDNLHKIFIPESVKFIDENAFSCCPNLKVRCYENSYVHKYCLVNKIKTETVSVGADL